MTYPVQKNIDFIYIYIYIYTHTHTHTHVYMINVYLGEKRFQINYQVITNTSLCRVPVRDLTYAASGVV